MADPNGLSHANLKLLDESNSIVAGKILENTRNDSIGLYVYIVRVCIDIKIRSCYSFPSYHMIQY